jgi:hypothetical protein
MDILRDISARQEAGAALAALREEKFLTDVEIRCDEGSLHAHFVLLAAQSEFFKALCKWSQMDSSPRTVSLTHVPYNVMSTMLDAVYTGTLDLKPDNALAVFEYSQELGFNLLARYSARVCTSPLSQDTGCFARVPSPACIRARHAGL